MPFFGLIVIFIFLPLTELWLLLAVGQKIGPIPTLSIVVLTGILGASMARWQGLKVLFHMRRDLAEGRLPAPYLLDGIMILLAAAVLLTPGFLTDAVGFSLLLPPVRATIKEWLRKALERKLRSGTIHITYS